MIGTMLYRTTSTNKHFTMQPGSSTNSHCFERILVVMYMHYWKSEFVWVLSTFSGQLID